MGKNLFEDADSDEDISKIEIDKDFVRRFEHNKRREDLHRLEELEKRGEVSDSSSSSSEEEDEEAIKGTKESDLKFYDAILRVRRSDPTIYDKNVKLFSSSEDEDEEEEEEEEITKNKKNERKKEKNMHLKDVVAKQLIEDGPEFGEEDERKVKEPRSKSYLEEQEANKRAFLEAAEETREEEEEDLFREKKKLNDVEEEDEEIHQKLDEVFGKDGNLDENEAFLKNFFLKKMWVEEDVKVDEADLAAVSEEEEEVEREERYEAAFNFRHQEEGGGRIEAHSRIVKDSVRKKTSSRKLQRQNKAERLKQAEIQRKEEVKRLKNEKKKEIREKLEKIKSIAGMSKSDGCALDEDDLEEDFDPDEYDRKMKKVFDGDYYQAEDYSKKPDFDEEDELLALPKDWIGDQNSEGFLAARSKNLKNEESAEHQSEGEHGGKRKRKRKISLREKFDLDKAFEEYYNLDYEGTIGDLKTRFKYRSVPANRFGLSTEEILMADDKELNKYVSLKKIAPYREEEWKVPREKRFHLKINKKLLGDEGGEVDRKEKKKREKEKKKREKEKKKRDKEEESSEKGDSKGEVSRRKKRRQREKELKISQPRLAMYGNVS